jgi:CUE domain
MAASDEEATLSIPSLAFVAVLSFFIIRYFMSSRYSDSAGTSRRSGQRFTGAQVEQLAQMFPQLSRRDIMWDLQRNGGSVTATTERVLAGRGLDRVGLFSVYGGLRLTASAGTAILPTGYSRLY